MIQGKERAILLTVIFILIIFIGGVIGYMLIEDFSFLDALYMTVITISTVGYKEVHDFSDGGRIFTIILIIISLGIIGYSFTRVTTFIVENKLKKLVLGATIKTGKKMKNHIILCGYGRNGQQATRELLAHKSEVVIIDRNNDISLVVSDSHARLMYGDATSDEILIKAGIRKASSLITTLPNDADNLFVVLTARSLNPELVIISRSFDERSEKKLRIAGVDNVVMPEKVGGSHMAKLIARPDTVEFLEHISVTGESPTNIEEIFCSDMKSEFINKTISEIGVKKKFGANIIGFKAPDGNYIVNPPVDTKLLPHSKLFLLGTSEQIHFLKEFLQSPEGPN